MDILSEDHYEQFTTQVKLGFIPLYNQQGELTLPQSIELQLIRPTTNEKIENTNTQTESELKEGQWAQTPYFSDQEHRVNNNEYMYRRSPLILEVKENTRGDLEAIFWMRQSVNSPSLNNVSLAVDLKSGQIRYVYHLHKGSLTAGTIQGQTYTTPEDLGNMIADAIHDSMIDKVEVYNPVAEVMGDHIREENFNKAQALKMLNQFQEDPYQELRYATDRNGQRLSLDSTALAQLKQFIIDNQHNVL